MDEGAAQQQLRPGNGSAADLQRGQERTMAAAREAQAQADGYGQQAQSSRQAMDEAAQTLKRRRQPLKTARQSR